MIWTNFINRIYLYVIDQYLSKASNVEFNRVQITDKLGIGTTGAPTGSIQVISNDAYPGLYFDNYNASGVSHPLFAFRRGRGTKTIPLKVEDTDFLSRLYFQGYDGGTWRSGAWITCTVDGATGVNTLPSSLRFAVTKPGTAPLEVMCLHTSGRILLGYGIVDDGVNEVQVKNGIGCNNITLKALLTFADNASAIIGGLTAGMVYKTASGQLMIVY